MPDTPDHANYSKRAMALDQVEVMKHFGFSKFPVIGHDRGGRVAHRMALDHPDKVMKLAVLDILPTYYLYTHVTLEFVQAYPHWFNYLQPAPGPENDLKAQADRRAAQKMSDVQAEYYRTTSTLENIHAMCEDYRAAASIDLKHDEADIRKRISAPLLTLWGTRGPMGRLYDVLAVWKERGSKVSGKGLPGGHNLQEEEPVWNEVLRELEVFLKA
jgi:haloacetate dehalogenase